MIADGSIKCAEASMRAVAQMEVICELLRANIFLLPNGRENSQRLPLSVNAICKRQLSKLANVTSGGSDISRPS